MARARRRGEIVSRFRNDSTRPLQSFALAGLGVLAGCGGAEGPAPEYAAALEPVQAPLAERIAITPTAVREAERTLLSLDGQGRLNHQRCGGVLTVDGTLHHDELVVARLEGDRVVDAEGRTRFRLEESRLTRADGRSITLEGGQLSVEDGPGIAFEIEGDSPKTALYLVAIAAICEP